MTSIQPRQPEVPPVTFENLAEISDAEPINALIYGPTKTGKTWLLGTLGPRHIYIDVGEGFRTLRSPLFRKLHPTCNPTIVRIREKIDWADVERDPSKFAPKAFDMLTDTLDYVLKHMLDKFDHISIDEATATRRVAMFNAVVKNTDLGRSKTQAGIKTAGLIVPAVQDYGMEMEMIEWFLAQYIPKLKEAGKNFFFAAHERITYDQARNAQGQPIINAPKVIQQIRPGFTGQTHPDEVSGMFENVWHTESAGGGNSTAYRIRIHGNEITVAGSRHAGIFQTIEPEPNLTKFLERIKAGTLHPSFNSK